MSKLDKKTINKVYVRNLFGLQWGWNYEKMQGLGYAWVMMPALKAIYGDDKEKIKKALNTQLAYFNTQPGMSHLIVGADMALEEELGEESLELVSSLKTGLMGPFAGVGDTIFIAIYRAVVFSVAAYMALEGNIVGLLIPLIACAIVMYIRYKFTWLGYKQGKKIAVGFADKIAPITEAASILGLTVVGALITSVIKYNINLTFVMGDVTLSVGDTLNKIMPGLVPIGIVFLSYWLLGKKFMNSTRLIVVLILLGMLLGNLQNIVSLFM